MRETKEQLAEKLSNKYIMSSCIDYGDLNNSVEKQIKESFIGGFSANKKLTDKIILDNLNKLRSELSTVQRVKLTKIVNEEKVRLLESQIEVLLEIQNKLK